jgi:hypothetical protein
VVVEGSVGNVNKTGPDAPAEDAERAFNETLKRMLKTPPTPHDGAKKSGEAKPVPSSTSARELES